MARKKIPFNWTAVIQTISFQAWTPMTVGFPAMQPTTSSFVVSILLLGGLRDSSRTLSSERMTIRKRQYWEDALAYFRHKSGKHVITCIKRCKTTKRFVGYPQHRIALVKAPLVCRNPCSLHELRWMRQVQLSKAG